MSSAQLAEFVHEIGQWANFYILFGTAAVTLVGLLFVAVSINIDTITNPRHRDLRALALNTFVSFLFLMLVAFIYLLPQPDPTRFGWAIIIANLSSVGRVALQGSFALKTEDRTLDAMRILLRFVLPGICHAATIPLAVLVMNGDFSWLFWLAGLLIVSLGLAVASVWDLMLIVGRDKRSSAM